MACGCKKNKTAGAAVSGCVGPNCPQTLTAKTTTNSSISTSKATAKAVARRITAKKRK